MKKAYEESYINAIGQALQNKIGGSYKVSEMAGAISAIPSGGGITPSGTKQITSNGTYDVTSFASADVSVPVGVFPSGTMNISANGEYTVTDKDKVNVNVPSGSVQPNLGTKTVTENGTYNASDDGLDGFSQFIVNVASSGGGDFPFLYEVGEYVPSENIRCDYNLINGEDEALDNRKVIEHHLGVVPNLFYINATDETLISSTGFVCAYMMPPHFVKQTGAANPSIQYMTRSFCINFAAAPRVSDNDSCVEFSDTTIKFGHAYSSSGRSSNAEMKAGCRYKWIAMRIPWLD